MPKGALIGVGRTAEVYDWEHGWVLKLYRDQFPRAWVEHEAALGRLIHDVGLPAPAVREVVEVEGRLGFVCERISGSSLADRVKRRPWRAAQVGKFLAQLHRRIHLAAVPPGLPRLVERLAGNIRDARALLGENVDTILAALEALPAGGGICHFDFHPGNVLEAGNRVYIIDWLTAGIGPPALDVARTLLLLESPFLPPGFPLLLHPVIRYIRQVLASAYLSEYFALSGLPCAELDLWRLPVAAARLLEDVPGEREWLLGVVRAAVASRGVPVTGLGSVRNAK